MSKNRSQGRILGAAVLMTVSTYVTYALGLVVGALVARSLGPDSYGSYAYLVWLSGWLVTLANHGLTVTAIRFVAEFLGQGSVQAAQSAHRLLLRYQHWSVALVAVGFVAASLTFPNAKWSVGPPILVAATVVCFVTRTTYVFGISVAKGYGAYHVEANSTIVTGLVNAALAAVLWYMNAGLEAFVLLFVGSSLAMSFMATYQLRSAGIRTCEKSLPSDAKREINSHLRWTTLLIFTSLFGRRSIETFVLNGLGSTAQLGYFTLAGGLARGSMDLVSAGLNTVLMPTMSRAFGAEGADKVHEIFRQSLRYLLFLGILLAGLSCFFATPAILVMYGEQYEPVAFALQVLQIGGGLTLGEAAFGALLSTTGHQQIWAKIAIVPVVVSATLSFALIPDHGLEGALLSASASRIIGFLALALVTIRSQAVKLPTKAIQRLLMSGALATAAAWAAKMALPPLLGQLAAGLLFTILFIGVTFLLRAWEPRDAELLEAVMARNPVRLGFLRIALRYMR